MRSALLLEVQPGEMIECVAAKAVEIAGSTDKPVVFVFNETPAIVEPGDWPELVAQRWARKHFRQR